MQQLDTECMNFSPIDKKTCKLVSIFYLRKNSTFLSINKKHDIVYGFYCPLKKNMQKCMDFSSQRG
jgi:hypothetical protein